MNTTPNVFHKFFAGKPFAGLRCHTGQEVEFNSGKDNFISSAPDPALLVINLAKQIRSPAA